MRNKPEDNRMRQPIHEQRSIDPTVIAQELRTREEMGDPHTVLPGQGKQYAAALIARGNEKLAQGGGAQRYQGPTEAGEVRPTLPRALREAKGMAESQVGSVDEEK